MGLSTADGGAQRRVVVVAAVAVGVVVVVAVAVAVAAAVAAAAAAVAGVGVGVRVRVRVGEGGLSTVDGAALLREARGTCGQPRGEAVQARQPTGRPATLTVGALSYEETVVYRNEAAIPSYLIVYRLP